MATDPTPIESHNAYITAAWKHAHDAVYKAMDRDGLAWFATHGNALLFALEALPIGSPADAYAGLVDAALKATGLLPDDGPDATEAVHDDADDVA